MTPPYTEKENLSAMNVEMMSKTSRDVDTSAGLILKMVSRKPAITSAAHKTQAPIPEYTTKSVLRVSFGPLLRRTTNRRVWAATQVPPQAACCPPPGLDGGQAATELSDPATDLSNTRSTVVPERWC